MTVAEACNEFFLFLTSFRRNAARAEAGEEVPPEAARLLDSPDEVQRRLLQIMETVESRLRSDPAGYARLDRVKPVLVFTADQIILNSGWNRAHEWRCLETEVLGREAPRGGEEFYELVQSRDYDDRELRELLCHALAIGFRGKHNMHAAIEVRNELYSRLDHSHEQSESGRERYTPQAYQHTIETPPPPPPRARAAQFAVASLALVVLLVMLSYYGYAQVIVDVKESANKVATWDPEVRQ